MSIWASIGNDDLMDLPKFDQYGTPTEGTRTVDVAYSGLSSVLRLLIDGDDGRTDAYLAPKDARELAGRLLKAADWTDAANAVPAVF